MFSLILTFSILFLGNIFFPEYVQSENIQTTILVSIVIIATINVIKFLVVLLIAAFPYGRVIALGFVIVIASIPGSLILASICFSGFMIKGGVTYAILTLVMLLPIPKLTLD